MTEPERMAALAEKLKCLSDELHAAAGEFDELGIPRHASEVRNWANHASIYANHLMVRVIQGAPA